MVFKEHPIGVGGMPTSFFVSLHAVGRIHSKEHFNNENFLASKNDMIQFYKFWGKVGFFIGLF